jgi:hypothetical protein
MASETPVSYAERAEARGLADEVVELNSERERLLNRMAAVQATLCSARARLSSLLARVEASVVEDHVSR